MADPITRADRIRDRELDADIDAEQDRRDAPDEPVGEVHDRLRDAVQQAKELHATISKPVYDDLAVVDIALLTEAADLLENYFAADYESQVRDLRMALATAQKARGQAERAFDKVATAVNEARKDWGKA